MIRSGQLKHKLTIMHPDAPALDAYGAAANTWTNGDTISAQLLDVESAETTESTGTIYRKTYTFLVRFRAGITVADRISYRGDVLDIRDIREIGWRKALEIKATVRNGNAGP